LDKAKSFEVSKQIFISPLLANLFLHYAFDKWMQRIHPDNPFERYADDAIVHCRSEAEAHRMKEEIEQRLAECGLTIHPDKTKIVYCRDQQRQGSYPQVQFDFLATVSSRGKPKPRGATFSWASFLRSAPKPPRRSAPPSGVGGHTDGRSSRSRNLPKRSIQSFGGGSANTANSTNRSSLPFSGSSTTRSGDGPGGNSNG
jgi:hypothetical protein